MINNLKRQKGVFCGPLNERTSGHCTTSETNRRKIGRQTSLHIHIIFHNYINDRVPVFFGSFFVENALYHD